MELCSRVKLLLHNVLKLFNLLLRERHLERDLILLRAHLVIDQDYAKWLSQNDIEEPEKEIVRVSRYDVFELSLEDHEWHIHHHQDECHEVNHTEDSNHNILVEECTHSECNQQTR